MDHKPRSNKSGNKQTKSRTQSHHHHRHHHDGSQNQQTHNTSSNRRSSSPNQRNLLSNRMRIASSGSTRGAFGLMPIDASAHDPHDIYQRQLEQHQLKQKEKEQQRQMRYIHEYSDAMITNDQHVDLKSHHGQHNCHSSSTGAKTIMIYDDEEIGASDLNNGTRTNIDKNYLSSPLDYSHKSRNFIDSKRQYQLQQQQQQEQQLLLQKSPQTRYHPNSSSADMYDVANAELEANKSYHYGATTSTSDNIIYHPVDDDEYYKEEEEEEEEEPPLTWYQYLIFHKDKPEFTTLQQSVWSVIIGILMGFLTAIWGDVIEFCVEFTWKTIPEYLLEIGIFTDLDGRFPLPYYMILCPAVFGGVLSYITAIMVNPKVPGQNEWIESLHRTGIMDHKMFFHVILISTAGMASGLSLGPEMPLVLTAGMIGSFIAVKCKQSVLSARVMNLTAASAGIGGFFGFPMAGALFVLELPHRMGLQYFEALSPATFASIVSVIVNRMVTGDEVKGMFRYPFLSLTLPSSIFWVVIIYGVVGSFVGTIYAKGLLWLKHWVHEWFHAPHDDDHQKHYLRHNHDYLKLDPHAGLHAHGGHADHDYHYRTAVKKKESTCTWIQKGVQRFFGIEHEPTRATVAGILVGLIVGLNCMLLPHNLFWGEAQLQTMIDRGMTPLPVFGYDDEPTSILTAYGYCLVDPHDERAGIKGFSTACAGIIGITKIFVVGISLGTGICGGHFWAPLVVACALSHFFTDIMANISEYIGYGYELSSYPCLAVLCIMGSAHVVTFRAQLAIILVLTLSINSFTTQEKLNITNGDYSAIFPLLVVACFVPLLLTRSVVFYAKQCYRGDITPIPEVLCEPNKTGTAHVCCIDNMDQVSHSYNYMDDLSIERSDCFSDDGLSLEPENYDKGDTIATARTEDTSLNSPSVDASKLSSDKVAKIRSNSDQMATCSKTEKSVLDPLNASIRLRSLSAGSRPSSITRVSSFGKIEDSNYQKPLLFQSRESCERESTIVKQSTSNSSSTVNAKVKSASKIAGRHRRTRSAGASFFQTLGNCKTDESTIVNKKHASHSSTPVNTKVNAGPKLPRYHRRTKSAGASVAANHHSTSKKRSEVNFTE